MKFRFLSLFVSWDLKFIRVLLGKLLDVEVDSVKEKNKETIFNTVLQSQVSPKNKTAIEIHVKQLFMSRVEPNYRSDDFKEFFVRSLRNNPWT